VTLIRTKLVGVTYHGRQERLKGVPDDCLLDWEHEKNNEFDENAILISYKGSDIGHLPRDVAKRVVDAFRIGSKITIKGIHVYGGPPPKSLGIAILVIIGEEIPKGNGFNG
jgi:hypothetical protein